MNFNRKEIWEWI